MDNDQIADLACECTEETLKSVYEYLQDNPKSTAAKQIFDITVRDTAAILRWLDVRYCLVEKNRLIEEYKSAIHDCKMAHKERLYTELKVASTRKALLKSLFPEIAKEVEE